MSFFGCDKPLGENQAFPASFPHFCAWCDTIFNANNLGQKYCSPECMNRAGRTMRQVRSRVA